MFTQFLGTAATVYGVLGALKSLLQAQQMLARRTSGAVSTCAPLSATASRSSSPWPCRCFSW